MPRSGDELIRRLAAGRSRGPAATLARGGLWIASQLYAAAVGTRNRLYDAGWLATHRVDCPVISIGNITAGGTGKTPHVAWLCGWLAARGCHPVILSRGYGARDSRGNDEQRELAARLPNIPHFQDPDRAAAARRAIAQHQPDVLVLDDGFQHRRLARDLDIVLVDATCPLGFGHLLPRGFLRERPVGLRRAAAIGLARCDLIEPQQLDSLERDLRRWNDHAICFRTSLAARSLLTSEGQTQPLQHLANSPVFAFAGIGNPEAFRQTLDRCGCRVVGFHSWPDHHEYAAPDIQRIRLAARRAGAAAIVCTHKDLVKLDQLDRATTSDERLPLYALIVDVVWHAGQADLEKLILDVVGAKPPR